MSTGAALVVGTAGHIDHGKTSLIRRLTGVDLDALPEERERGITIALGFTPLELAGRRLAFVDVPGHERLVRTMIAGATGIDAVLLCVSAVDGVMPQTREHVAILELLGVRHGVVALTMADLVDTELLELAQEDVADLLQGTALASAPIVPFSAITGQGEQALRHALAALPEPITRDASGPFRLPVDRAFSRAGFGTVVTGTAWSGQLEDGATVELLPDGGSARVRGLQTHGQSVAEVQAGWRCALNLAGVDIHSVGRGTVITRGVVPCPAMIDVRYHHLPDVPPLQDGSPVRVLLGTSERMGRLYMAEDRPEIPPGRVIWAQLRLEAPLPCLPGDRFVLRRTSPLQTLGGGEVLDPWAARMRHKHRVAWGKQLARLHAGDQRVWLERAGEAGLSQADWERRGNPSLGVLLAGRYLAETVVARLEGRLVEALAAYHRQAPLSLGAHRRELRRDRLAHLDERVFDALVDRLASSRALEVNGPLVRRRGFAVVLTPDQEQLRHVILASVRATGLAGLSVKATHEAHPQPEVTALIRLAEASEQLVGVAGIGWVSRQALDGLEHTVRGWFEGHERLSPGDFKELTGLTRKAAIPLLEWLDRQRITRRDGDARVAGAELSA